MAVGRESEHPVVHEGTTIGHADERRDPEDQGVEVDKEDAAGESAVVDQATARCAGEGPQEDDLLIRLSTNKYPSAKVPSS